MARHSHEHWKIRVTTGAALMLQTGAPALADPPAANQLTEERSSEALHPRIDALGESGSWLTRNFHLQKSSGLGYTHHFTLSDRPFVFKVQGPVMRKQKALGLTFKIRF